MKTARRNSGSNTFKSTLARPLLVAAAYDDGCVTVWEIMTNANTTTVKHHFWPDCAKNSIHDVIIDVSGSRLAVRSYTAVEHKVFVYDLTSAQLLYIYDALYVFDSTTGAVINSIKEDRGRTISSYDDSHIITGGHDEKGARCWSVHSGQRIRAHWAESYAATVVYSTSSAD
jgi:hypothetical protein